MKISRYLDVNRTGNFFLKPIFRHALQGFSYVFFLWWSFWIWYPILKKQKKES